MDGLRVRAVPGGYSHLVRVLVHVQVVQRLLDVARQPQGEGGQEKAKGSFGLPSALDDLGAVELLGALIDRFGTSDPPPPRLLNLLAKLREARDWKQAAVTAQHYAAAKRHHDEELRLEADAVAQVEAWRQHR